MLAIINAINHQCYQSSVIKVVVLVPLRLVLDRIFLLLGVVLVLNLFSHLLRDLLMHECFVLARDNIELSIVLFDDVLRPHIAVDFLVIVDVAQDLPSTRLLIGMADGIIAQTE